MANRGQYLRNKASHDQRQFATAKPTAMKQDEGTAWISGAVQKLQARLLVGEYYGLDTAELLWVGLSEEKLRVLSGRGILHMRALRDPETNKFLQFEWALTESGSF